MIIHLAPDQPHGAKLPFHVLERPAHKAGYGHLGGLRTLAHHQYHLVALFHHNIGQGRVGDDHALGDGVRELLLYFHFKPHLVLQLQLGLPVLPAVHRRHHHLVLAAADGHLDHQFILFDLGSGLRGLAADLARLILLTVDGVPFLYLKAFRDGRVLFQILQGIPQQGGHLVLLLLLKHSLKH